MHKRSCIRINHGIICSDDDLLQILPGNSFRDSSSFSGQRQLLQESDRRNPTSSNFFEMKVNKLKTESLEPDVLQWDFEKQLSFQPELLGSVIESYIRNNRCILGESILRTDTPTTKISESTSGILKSNRSPEVKKIVVVADELENLKRLQFSGYVQKVFSRPADSLESALKSMNV